jgi:CspA family cold shock protein
MAQGRVKWFDQAKFYGFLIDDADGTDIFVHGNDVPGGTDWLEKGAAVSYTVGQGRGGRTKAEAVKPVE